MSVYEIRGEDCGGRVPAVIHDSYKAELNNLREQGADTSILDEANKQYNQIADQADEELEKKQADARAARELDKNQT